MRDGSIEKDSVLSAIIIRLYAKLYLPTIATVNIIKHTPFFWSLPSCCCFSVWKFILKLSVFNDRRLFVLIFYCTLILLLLLSSLSPMSHIQLFHSLHSSISKQKIILSTLCINRQIASYILCGHLCCSTVCFISRNEM